MTGVSVTVIPGYQAWSAEQRETLLRLAEAGELAGRTVWARELADGAVKVTDRASTWIIYLDGEKDRIAVPTGRGTDG